MDYQRILDEIYEENKNYKNLGKVASYIPELAKVSADKYGIFLLTVDDLQYEIGDSREVFSIQSISKVFSLAYSMCILGNKLWERVGVEPSGNPFNSIAQLEYEKGIPRNPFINSGAIVMADILVSHLKDAKQDFLELVRDLAGNQEININPDVYESEKQSGYRNEALANMLKAYKNLDNTTEEVLDFYYFHCSIEMSCADLAHAFIHFADHSKDFKFDNFFLTRKQIKRINAIMLTCGFYDEAGEFSFEVGLPGKSGVGGGIVALRPNDYSVAVWSPPLNDKGNSTLSMRSLELLTLKTGFSIF